MKDFTFHGFFSSNWRVFPCKNSVSYFSISISIILFIKLIYLKYLLNLYREKKKIKIIDLLFSKHNDFFFFFFNLLQDPSNIYVVSISFV